MLFNKVDLPLQTKASISIPPGLLWNLSTMGLKPLCSYKKHAEEDQDTKGEMINSNQRIQPRNKNVESHQ